MKKLSVRSLATFVAGALAVAAFTAGPAVAATYVVDGVHSSVAFQIRHLLTKVNGQFDVFDGTVVMADDPAESSVEFTIDAASINTFNEQRDNHLRSPDFFDVENHETIAFESTRVVETGDGRFDVTGILDMHGVEKEITLPVSFLGEMQFRGGTRGGFEAETVIDRKDWGIVWNTALDQGGAVLGDEVTIEINLQVIKQEEDEEGSAD